jgi:exodeoxyribonuclease VII large subunit
MLDDLLAPAPPPAEPPVFTVSELTRGVRTVLESSFGTVWVEGEVSNYRKQPSGHQYFTLKDASSQLACVWFAARAGAAWRRQIPLADGMQVQARGALTVYEARGQYQLNVQLVQAAGAGLLQARFEALKRKLEAEGLFDPARKRPLPKFPAAVGLVTSATGAALRDMLNILARRAPWVRVIVHPVRVQGEGAAAEIAAGLAQMNRCAVSGLAPVEVLVVGRGGGSVEDLWAFNEEAVARAIVASAIPVVSAVGHEVDFTIADFVADLRAPTPSAAAELIVPDSAALARHLAQLAARAQRRLFAEVERRRNQLEYLRRSALFREPAARLAQARQRVDLAAEALRRAARESLQRRHRRVAEAAATLRQHRPDQVLALHRARLAMWRARLAERAPRLLAARRQRLEKASAMLRLLSPQATLERGYSITATEGGKAILSAAAVEPGAKLVTTLRDGALRSTVDATDSREPQSRPRSR